MNNSMINKNLKFVGLLIILVAAILLSAFWAIANAPTPPLEPRPLPFDPFSRYREWLYRRGDIAMYYSPGDIEIYYTLQTVLSTVNATLLVFLMITYIDIYRKLKSEFTIGLIIFSMILLFYALVSNPMMQGIFGFRGVGLGPFAMLPALFTCLALAVLLYLTLK